MNIPALFAWRYFRAGRQTGVIHLISWISMVAITVGTAALIIVLSVFNGFQGLVEGLYGDFYADMRMVPARGNFFPFPDGDLARIRALPGIAAASRTVGEKAVLMQGSRQDPVVLKGVDDYYATVSGISRHTRMGRYQLGSADKPLLVAGRDVARALGAYPATAEGDGLVVYVPDRAAIASRHAAGSLQEGLRSYNVQLSGTFGVQEEFDNTYAFTNLGFMQYMMDLRPQECSSVEIALASGANASVVRKQLAAIAGNGVVIQTRMEQNQSLFTVMQVEKWVVFGVLALILVIAAFNMIGALTMLILEKQQDIAILQALGASRKKIRNIFLGVGFALAGAGGLAGMALALLICNLQIRYHLIKLGSGTNFLIDYYPVAIKAGDFLLVAVTVMIVALLASWLPAKRAAQRQVSLR